MKFEINKKTIISIGFIIFLLSALIYNILYINNKKNEIIEEVEEDVVEENFIEDSKTIFIDVGGEILNPGLYELPENSRINDAINIAGGITDEADLTNVNLAYVLTDAMKIVIPKKEVKKITTISKKITPEVVTTEISISENTGSNTEKININTANKEQLKSLTGIGDATAQKIIDHRSQNGKFNSIEDIKNVSGIGESKYEKIKEKIFV